MNAKETSMDVQEFMEKGRRAQEAINSELAKVKVMRTESEVRSRIATLEELREQTDLFPLSIKANDEIKTLRWVLGEDV